MKQASRVFVLLVLFLAAACGGSAEKADVTIPVFAIMASEPSEETFSFDLPGSIRGGVIRLRLTNAGAKDHDFQLAKVVSGHTLEDVVKLVSSADAPLESWLEPAGGVGTTRPGESNDVTLNLTPGAYWYFDTESSDIGGKEVSHAANGMAGLLALSGESGASMPQTKALLIANEYTFTATGFNARENTIGFRNAGRQLHHAVIVPMLPGKTIEDVKSALLTEEQGPPPLDFDKAVTAPIISSGQVVVFGAHLQAATNYALLCFIWDRDTAGPPHTEKGMITQLAIP